MMGPFFLPGASWGNPVSAEAFLRPPFASFVPKTPAAMLSLGRP